MTLSIYKGTPPNTQHSTFYYIAGNSWFQSLRTELSANLIATVTPDKYAIVNNTIRVDHSNNPVKYRDASYLMDDRTGFCYFVDSVNIYGTYTEINVAMDYWGTYAPQMSLSNCFIHQTNKVLSNNGIYLPIKATGNTPQYTEYKLGNSFTQADITAVFTINEEIRGQVSPFTSYAEGRRYLAAIDLDGSTITLNNICDIVSGITKRIVGGSYDAGVAIDNCWLVPSQFVAVGSAISLKYVDYNANEQTISAYRVPPFTIDYPAAVANINPNYNYYIGTKYNRMQLPRRVGNVDFTISALGGNDDYKLFIKCGAEMIDLSNDFQLGLTHTASENSLQSAIAHNLSNMSSVIMGAGLIAAAPATGGTSAVSGVSSIINGVNGYLQTGNVSYSQGANVIALYIPTETGRTAMSPIMLTTYQSIANETVRAGMYGAEFSEAYTGTFLYLFAHYGTLAAGYDTYLKMDCDVENVPHTAAQYIQNVLATGNRFIALAAP